MSPPDTAPRRRVSGIAEELRELPPTDPDNVARGGRDRATEIEDRLATHLRSDHTMGLADLILTPWTLERKEPLELYGPPGLRAMAGHIEKAYREDIEIRLHGGEPSNPTGYKVVVHEIRNPGEVYRDANVVVTALRVPHGS